MYWIVIRASVNFTVCVYNYDTVICGLAMFAHYVLYCMMLYVHIMYIYTHIYLGYVVFIFFCVPSAFILCEIGLYRHIISGWWFGTIFIFPYIGNNHPN